MARSPNYPAVAPPQAIENAKALWQKLQRGTTTAEELAQLLGYKGLTGASRPHIAALKKYGILEKRGKGLALTDRAIALAIRGSESVQYRQAVRDAILDVELFNVLLKEHTDASRRMVQEHLIADLAFTPEGAERATEAFFAAKHLLSAVGDDAIGKADAPDDVPVAKVGDLVQWTSQGVAQFEEPRQVLGLSDDGEYAFLDGSSAGIPLDQLVVEKPGSPPGEDDLAPPQSPFGARRRKQAATTKEALLPLDSGPVSVCWPDTITPAEFQDVQDWFKILERKIGRSAERKPERDQE